MEAVELEAAERRTSRMRHAQLAAGERPDGEARVIGPMRAVCHKALPGFVPGECRGERRG